MIEKYKIWDVVNQDWFRPEYPGTKVDRMNRPYQTNDTRELLFSQSGEIYLREKKGEGPDALTHILVDEENPPYIICVYTGIKDNNERKAYTNDVIVCNGVAGTIVKAAGCFTIQWEASVLRKPELLAFDNGQPRRFEIIGNTNIKK